MHLGVAVNASRKCSRRDRKHPRVGAVVAAADGRRLAVSWRTKKTHAEFRALRDLARRGVSVRGGTVYATLEPCSHARRGRKTICCADEIARAGIRRVVIGLLDPNPRIRGRGVEKLQRLGLKVVIDGSFSREIETINKEFLTKRRLILFDLWDTLLKTGVGMSPASYFSEILGIPNSSGEELKRILYQKKHGTVRRLAGALARLAGAPAAVKKAEAAVRAYSHRNARRARLLPGAVSVLRALRREGYVLGIVSNSYEFTAEPALRKFGLGRLVDGVFLSHRLGLKKPGPHIFQLAARRLRVGLKETIMVGDDAKNDACGAFVAGVGEAFWLTGRSRGKSAGADKNLLARALRFPDLLAVQRELIFAPKGR